MRKNKKNPLCTSSGITCRLSGYDKLCHNLSNYVVKFLLTNEKKGSKIKNITSSKRNTQTRGQKGQVMKFIHFMKLFILLEITFISIYFILRNFISHMCAKHILKKISE